MIDLTEDKVLYRHRAAIQGHFLRQKDWARLSRNYVGEAESNVLRDETIAAANIYSCLDFGKLAEIFAGNKPKHDPAVVSMATSIAYTGAIVIPYFDAASQRSGFRRLRTDFVEPKYLSPCGSNTPPYVIPHFSDPRLFSFFKKLIVQELSQEMNLTLEQIQPIAEKVLAHTRFDELLCKEGNPDPKTPLVVVEGEFKALAIADALLDTHKAAIKQVLSSPTPNLYDIRHVKVPQKFNILGIGGVWNMIENVNAATKDYRVLPEWRAHFPRETVYICFDSDSKYKVEVAQACQATAQALQKTGAKAYYIQIDSPANIKKMGADDYIKYAGPQAFLDLVGKARPITGQVGFHFMCKEAAKTGNAMEAILGELPNQLQKPEAPSISR